jgi:hypothetical protein
MGESIFEGKKRNILSSTECKAWESKFVQSDTERFHNKRALDQAIRAETDAFVDRIIALRAQLG